MNLQEYQDKREEIEAENRRDIVNDIEQMAKDLGVTKDELIERVKRK